MDTSSDGLSVNESHRQYPLTAASSIGGTNTGVGVSGGYGDHYYKQSTLHHSKCQRVRGRPVSDMPPSGPNGQIATSEHLAGPLSMDMIDRSFLGAANVSTYHDEASHPQPEVVNAQLPDHAGRSLVLPEIGLATGDPFTATTI